MQPLVSFIVLCYNHREFIGECVQSILTQQGDYQFEVIVVDDASPDHSADVIHQFSDSRIHLIQHSCNQGHIATVTDGLKQANGSYIARIDGDDRYRPEFLKHVLPIFEQYADVGMVYADTATINSAGEINTMQNDRVHDGQDFHGNEFVHLLQQNFICAPTIIARRHVWERCLPVLDGLAFHDWYFTLMMARQCNFYYIHQVLADYRIHANNMHTHIARNKTEEASIFRLLDKVYNEKELYTSLEVQKQKARHRIFGTHYLTLGDKYFGNQYSMDAQRCYLAALRHQPKYLFNFGLMRRLTATYLGQSRYEKLRDSWKSSAT